jgi:hypothetical protein
MQKVALISKKKTQNTNKWKINDISSADENKYQNITVETLFKTDKKAIHLFLERRLRSCSFFFDRNNAGLKILVKFCLNRQVTHLPS